MLNIGDKIVYPMHGAGTIDSIEEKEILGIKNKYYIMKISLNDMKVMIPIDSIENLGVRKVIDKEDVNKLLTLLSKKTSIIEKNWNKRYRQNESIIRNGDIEEVGKLVRNLTLMDKSRKLSIGEKKVLVNAKEIFVSELMLVMNKSKEEIEELVENTISNI